MTGPRIGVVIVTYRSERVVGACLSSLIEHLASDAPIVVVDNASTDGTKEVVRRFAPRVRLIEGERNVGFGAANNLGAGPDGLGSAVDWILLSIPT